MHLDSLNQKNNMKIGEKLFNFKLQSTDGTEYTNYSFADKYALCLIVTCNHCPTAQAYWNRIFKLSKSYEEDSLCIVAINPNDATKYPQDSLENMQRFLRNKSREDFVYLHDEEQEVTKKLGAERTPEVFLFNAKRELVYRGAIDDAWENENMVTQAYLEDAIEYCLDGLDIDYPEISAVGCTVKWLPGNEPSN
jgi:glutathione peroxidase-family protein